MLHIFLCNASDKSTANANALYFNYSNHDSGDESYFYVYDSTAMSKSDYVNITQNATTIKTDYIYEIHVNTDSGTYTLDYKALPR